MEKLFKLKANNTTVKTEISSGLTTFLAMVYILAVNPSILSAAGMDSGSVFTATCISAAMATACMAFLANYPVALASGMGLNAYFAYTVVPNLAASGVENPWKIALTAVLVEGIIFILLSFTNFREKLVNDIPNNLKYGITAGIGLFIARFSSGCTCTHRYINYSSTVQLQGSRIYPHRYIGYMVSRHDCGSRRLVCRES